MTPNEFQQYWTITYGQTTLGDAGSVTPGPGSASFFVGDQIYTGIKQYNLQKGVTYDFQIGIDGTNIGSTYYFALFSEDSLLCFLSSSGDYNIPVMVTGNNIELRYYGNDVTYSNSGSLYYFRAIAPITSYGFTKNSPLGPVLVGFSDGKEDYNGELKGTTILTTSKTRQPNPFLNYMYVSSSIIPNSQIFNPNGGTSTSTSNPYFS